MAKVSNIQIENAQIRFRNFRGEPDKYNKNGKRTFSVLIDPHQAEELKAEGWNIKYLKPRDDDEEPQAFLTVEVKFANFPPQIHVISGRSQQILNEQSVKLLDTADITNIDVVITPYAWKMDNGSSGIKAYLKSAWVTLDADPFAQKYSRLEDDFEEVADDGSLPW